MARRRKFRLPRSNRLISIAGLALAIIVLLWLFPLFVPSSSLDFPVTVNPGKKKINENARVNLLLASKYSLFRTAETDERTMRHIVGDLMSVINETQQSANISNAGGKVVVITPGMRKEQVASAFAHALGWNYGERHDFLTPLPGATLPFKEGSFTPGTYIVTKGMSPVDAQAMVNERFTKVVLSNYGTSTEKVVPLKDALIIASIIQRETISTDGMRLISGIIWNRLFMDMNLQIDATLQYSKANNGISSTWWPEVVSYDKYLYSPFNTYMHEGLPPEPIANPSVAAILAALNPIETNCIFYFNDPKGNFHCSATYDEHRRLLKEFY